MAALSFSKSSLQQERLTLKTLQRFLPSLELKRQQLAAEYKKAAEGLAEAEKGAAQASGPLRDIYAILGAAPMELSGLVRVGRIQIEEEHVLGLRMPKLVAVEFVETPYSFLATPFWVDSLVSCLKDVATYRLRLQVYRQRVQRLETGLHRTAQRVNLFEKVLIPRAKENISRIQIALADLERSAVVISKISKAKRARFLAAQKILQEVA